MKRPIAWHKENLKNMQFTATELSELAMRQKKEADRTWCDVEALQVQIARAEREGRTEFDAEKFNVKRKP
jgi:hypothetical protein